VQAGGGFSLKDGVVVCADKLNVQTEVTNTIRHELVHAFDHCRAHVDWTDIDHLACAEIRAQNLSGECSWFSEVGRGNMNVRKQHQFCVRRRAELSVLQVHPDPKAAAAAVNRVFDRCFADTEPYTQIP
jgi:inner membrane protease ATP23